VVTGLQSIEKILRFSQDDMQPYIVILRKAKDLFSLRICSVIAAQAPPLQ